MRLVVPVILALIYAELFFTATIMQKVATPQYTPCPQKEEIRRTPVSAIEAFEEALPEERKYLYNPALETILEEQHQVFMCIPELHRRVTPRDSERMLAKGKLLDKLEGGYLHRLDENFLMAMKDLVKSLEGGISKGIYADDGTIIMRPTNRGVEDKFYRRFLRLRGWPREHTILELSAADTQEIIYRDLWLHYNLNQIEDHAVAALIFDGVLNSGNRAMLRLVRKHIPRDVLGLSGIPTTFGERCVNLVNTMSKISPETRDKLLISLMDHRRKILESSKNFMSPELGRGLARRLRKLEKYTKDNLRDPEFFQQYQRRSFPGSHTIFRRFKAKYKYNPLNGTFEIS